MTSLLSRAFIQTSLIVSLLTASSGYATSLPGGLAAGDVERAIGTLAFGSTHRGWTAHSVPSSGLGLDLGVETSFLFRQGLDVLGDGDGVIPRVVPVPRLWGAWDLPSGFDVSFSAIPGRLIDGIEAYGVSAQWVFLQVFDPVVSSSFNVSYTYANAFGDLRTHTLMGDVQISRDLILWQPYAGGGVGVATGAVKNSLLKAGVSETWYSNAAVHFFAGARIDFVAKLAFQVDLFNTKAGLSFLLANSF